MTTESRAHAPEAGDRRAKRRHPAARSRVLAAGLSAGATVVLVGAMPDSGFSAHPEPADPAPVVVVVRRPAGDVTVVGSTSRAPAITPTDAPAVTESEAS